MALIPFDEVSRRLALSRRTYLGLREIPIDPIDRIVGSVDRSADFRRDFKPQRRLSRGRLAALREAFRDGVMPAINVFEVGGAYSWRMATIVSRLRANVAPTTSIPRSRRLESDCEIPSDADVVQLLHTELQRKLFEPRAAPSRARPDAVIGFTFVDGYTQFAEITVSADTAPSGGAGFTVRFSR